MYVVYSQPLGSWKISPPPAARTAFLCDLHAAQEDVRAGTTQDTRQQRLYWQWADFCATLLVNPALQDQSIPPIKLLQFYGHRVRHARYSKRQMDQLGVESVSQVRGVIAVTHLLGGLPDPIKTPNHKLALFSTSTSPGCSKPTGLRIPQSGGEKLSHSP